VPTFASFHYWYFIILIFVPFISNLRILVTTSKKLNFRERSPVYLLHRPKLGVLDGKPLPLSMKRIQQHDDLKGQDDQDNNLFGDCQFMHEWQTQSFSSCNILHEIEEANPETFLNLINCGTARCAFSFYDQTGKRVVIKRREFSKKFDSKAYKAARRDSLAMERLTSSQYVLDIYGSCATSQLTEGGQGGTIHDLIKISRMEGFRELPSLSKLKIAYQLTTGVADMHSFEKDKIPSIAHNDVCCHQFILVHGVYKLNDFHLGSFIHRNTSDGTSCRRRPGFNRDLMKLRAPEEMPRIHAHQDVFVYPDKVDVYMLGNVLYYIQTSQWLYEGVPSVNASMKIYLGEHSPFPLQIMQSTDPNVQILSNAINMLWTDDHTKRPSARVVSNFLGDSLRAQNVDFNEAIKVHVPPLRADHRFTDEDFYQNLD